MIYLRVFFLLLSAQVISEPARGEEGQALFNGKDLDGWVAEGVTEYKEKGKTEPVWTIEKDLIHCAGKGYGFLRYDKRKYADFAFHVEYRMAPKCNSGIGVRTVPYDPKKDPETRPSYACYEIQLLDDADKMPSKYGSCSLYRYVAPKENAVKSAPEWNVLDVECIGPHIRITMNSKEVLNVDQSKIEEIKDKPLEGYLCLQNHGGKIDFRNVRVREIKKE